MSENPSRRGLLAGLGALCGPLLGIPSLARADRIPPVPCGAPSHQARLDRSWRTLPAELRPSSFVNYYGEQFPFPALIAPDIAPATGRESWPVDRWAPSCAAGDPIPLSRSGSLPKRLLSDEPSEICLHLAGEPETLFSAALEALTAQISEAAHPGTVLVPVGAHHSCSGAYRPPAFPGAIAVDTGGLNLVTLLLGRGPGGGPLVLCGAGVRICELNEILWAQGLALPTVGSFDVQTIAGAMATGTHGSSASVGAISDAAVALLVLAVPGGSDSSPRWQHLQIQARPEDCEQVPFAARTIADRTVFEAFVVSIGLLGIVTAVVIEVREAFYLLRRRFPRRWREIKPEMATLATTPPAGVRGTGWRYELHVNPVAVKGSRKAPEWVGLELQLDEWGEDPDYRSQVLRLNGFQQTVAEIGELFDLRWLRPSMQFTREMYSDEAGIYADRGYRVLREPWTDAVRAWGTEWFVPLSHGTEVIDWLLQRNATLGHGHKDRLINPFAVRFVPTKRGLICPSRYEPAEPACTIEPSILVRHNARASRGIREVLVRWTDAMLAESDKRGWKARLHWGLVNDPLDAARFQGSYPDADAWREVFLTFNRHGHFDTTLGRQLGLHTWRAQHLHRKGAYEDLILASSP